MQETQKEQTRVVHLLILAPPLADALLANTPKYGSSNMMRMRKLVNNARFNASAYADEGYSDDGILRAIMQDYDIVKLAQKAIVHKTCNY